MNIVMKNVINSDEKRDYIYISIYNPWIDDFFFTTNGGFEN
jgi:hypothetical protein